MTQQVTWLDVRDTTGRLLFRFDPKRDLVQIAERRRVVVIDLAQYRAAQHEQPAQPCSRSVQNPLLT
jgi:hypothetical protein